MQNRKRAPSSADRFWMLLALLLLGAPAHRSPAEIGKAGERVVAEWLRRRGLEVRVNTRFPGSTDIIATAGNLVHLVQAKSTVYPGAVPELSPEEIRNIKARAAGIGAQAWAAYVWLNGWLRPIGEPAWKRL